MAMRNATSNAPFLFRKGKTSSEEDMKPDVELIEAMCKYKISVKDLLNYIYYADCFDINFSTKMNGFLEWYAEYSTNENKEN